MASIKVTNQSNKETPLIGKVVTRICRIINIVGLVILALMTLFILVDVFGRYFFNRPIAGSYDSVQLMMTVLVSFALAYTAVRKGHIKINWLISLFPSRVQSVINSITSFLCLGISAVITWQVVLQAESLKLQGATPALLQIPIYPFLYAIAFGSALLCLVFIYNFFEHLIRAIKGAGWLLSTGSLLLIILVLFLFAVLIWEPGLLTEVNPNTVVIISLCLLVVLLFSGMPVALALASAGFLGLFYLVGADKALQILGNVPYTTTTQYILAVVPLFLFMSALMQQSGIAQAVYLAATSWFGRLPGSLALSSVVACAFNSASNVSSQSNAATVGTVALPQMVKNNYNSGLAVGSIAAGGSITILIPPSIGLIVYAIFTETSIGRLFLASLIPAVLCSVFFVLYVLIAGSINRNLAPKSRVPSGIIGFIILLPLGVLITPLAGIYGGIFTPTEAAATAAIIAFIMAVVWAPVWGRSVFSVLKNSLLQAVHTTSMIALVLIGAIIFSYFLSMSRMPSTLVSSIAGLSMPPIALLLLIFVVYIILGCLIEPLTLIVFSLPILFPLIVALGFDPIWFGVILMLLVGIAMLLPPARVNLRVAQAATPGYPLKGIMTGIIPFVVLMVIVLFMLVRFPQLALWLPNLMR